MLMDMDDIGNECTKSDLNEEEAMVDMKGEVINALVEIDRLKLKKRKQK